MSDPVTNVDVEDVLSSIRRLVSDTKSVDRQETKELEAAEETSSDMLQEDVKPADALILTSALRVNTPAEDSVPEFRHAEMPNFRQTVSENIQSETEEPAPDHTDWPSLSTDDYYEDDVQAEAAPVIDFIRHSRNAEPETAFEDADEAWEPEFIDATLEEGNSDDAIVEGVQGESMDATDFEEETGDQGASYPDEAREDLELAIEAELSGDTSRLDLDESSLVDEAVFASAAAASVMDGLNERVEEETDVDLADFDENVIEEDALRDLVTEIVRQELSGELGERITRNVRKLVRREIHRALMTREFE